MFNYYMLEYLVATMFDFTASFEDRNLTQSIFEFVSTNFTNISSMELTPWSTIPGRPFPYLLPSYICGHSLGILSSQIVQTDISPSPTIMRLSTRSTTQLSSMSISQTIQNQPFTASIASLVMPFLNIANMVGG